MAEWWAGGEWVRIAFMVLERQDPGAREKEWLKARWAPVVRTAGLCGCSRMWACFWLKDSSLGARGFCYCLFSFCWVTRN